MDRKKALKNIAALLSLPIIPLGLISKDDEIEKHYQAGLDAIDMDIIAQTDKDAAYLSEMFPHDIEIIYDKHSEKSNKLKQWINKEIN